MNCFCLISEERILGNENKSFTDIRNSSIHVCKTLCVAKKQMFVEFLVKNDFKNNFLLKKLNINKILVKYN